MKKGWHGESRRHSLARRGIKTAQKVPFMHITKSQNDKNSIMSKTLTRILNELRSDGKKPLDVAKSLKNKHHLVLVDDSFKTTDGRKITSFSILVYDDLSKRGSFNAGESREEANIKFVEKVRDWNKYNSSLGKLKILNQ